MVTCANLIRGNRLLKKVLEDANYAVRSSNKADKTPGDSTGSDTRQVKAIGSRAEFLKGVKNKVEALKVSDGGTRNQPPWQSPVDSQPEKGRSYSEIISESIPKTAVTAKIVRA